MNMTNLIKEKFEKKGFINTLINDELILIALRNAKELATEYSYLALDILEKLEVFSNIERYDSEMQCFYDNTKEALASDLSYIKSSVLLADNMFRNRLKRISLSISDKQANHYLQEAMHSLLNKKIDKAIINFVMFFNRYDFFWTRNLKNLKNTAAELLTSN